jgi:hypothetical protein
MVMPRHIEQRVHALKLKPKRLWRWVGIVLGVAFLLPAMAATTHRLLGDTEAPWWAADQSRSGLAPLPAATPEAILQVYAARAWGWRGALGVHTWVAAKRRHADTYLRLEVIGWGVRHGRPAVRISNGNPDARWYGQEPELLAELRGPQADEAIDKVLAAASAYPYRHEYRVWPGPNSNTFTAHMARAAPELAVDLPTTAIGKDFLADGALVAPAPSGTGYQLSLWGLLGVTIARVEGLEFNLFGLNAGIDASPPALRLPGLGRLGRTTGPRSTPVRDATLIE